MWEADQISRKAQIEAQSEAEKQKLEFEKLRAENEHQRWLADRDDRQ